MEKNQTSMIIVAFLLDFLLDLGEEYLEYEN